VDLKLWPLESQTENNKTKEFNSFPLTSLEENLAREN
jgi:hypothetical protein